MDFNNDGKISFWEMFPYWFDKLRVFPRVFITVYIIMFWRVTLTPPTNTKRDPYSPKSVSFVSYLAMPEKEKS